MKIALCFWGLTRSLKYTIESIKKNILQPLDDGNIEYRITPEVINAYEQITTRPNLIGLSQSEADKEIDEYLKEAHQNYNIINEYLKNSGFIVR